ncbi:MAG: hypothetical protein ACP5NW_05980 [Candidatus Woesearchaeota archaeon]
MELKELNDNRKHINDVASKFSQEDRKNWNLYDRLSSRFSKLCYTAAIVGLVVSGSGTLQRNKLEKHKPIGVYQYEQADARLDSTVNNFDRISALDLSGNHYWKGKALDDIAALESERERLMNTDVYKNHEAKISTANKQALYGIMGGVMLAGLFAGLSAHYDSKKNRLWKRKEKEN